MEHLAVEVAFKTPNDDAVLDHVEEDDAPELQRLDHTAQHHRKDVVDLQRGVDRRKDLLENEELGVLLGVLVPLGFDHAKCCL